MADPSLPCLQVAFFGYASKDPNASPLKNHYVYEKREGGAPQQLRTVSHEDCYLITAWY